jgi:hypothetical protein
VSTVRITIFAQKAPNRGREFAALFPSAMTALFCAIVAFLRIPTAMNIE